jgi:hypothetical protein
VAPLHGVTAYSTVLAWNGAIALVQLVRLFQEGGVCAWSSVASIPSSELHGNGSTPCWRGVSQRPDRDMAQRGDACLTDDLSGGMLPGHDPPAEPQRILCAPDPPFIELRADANLNERLTAVFLSYSSERFLLPACNAIAM